MADLAWIELVLARADELRAKGVLSIGPGTATFAPADPPPPSNEAIKTEAIEDPIDPFEDPASYPSGRVPSYDIKPLDEE